MLVITVKPVMGQASGPALTEFAGQLIGHGREDLKFPCSAWAWSEAGTYPFTNI
jgi:hypothetical protein